MYEIWGKLSVTKKFTFIQVISSLIVFLPLIFFINYKMNEASQVQLENNLKQFSKVLEANYEVMVAQLTQISDGTAELFKQYLINHHGQITKNTFSKGEILNIGTIQTADILANNTSMSDNNIIDEFNGDTGHLVSIFSLNEDKKFVRIAGAKYSDKSRH